MKRFVSCALFFGLVITLSESSTWARAEASNSEKGWARTPRWARADSQQVPESESDAETAPTAPARQRRPAAHYSSSSFNTPFAPGSNNLSLDVGQVFLMGNLGERYGDSIGTRLHYTYGVSDLFSFDSSLGYSTHSEGAFSMTSILTGLRTNLAWYDKVIPHAIFGMGFYRPSYRQENLSPLLFGVHLGAGVNLEITRSLFFGTSLTFHSVFGSDKVSTSGTIIPIGGSFTSFLVTAGVTF